MKWKTAEREKDRARENSRKQKPQVMPNAVAHPLPTNPTSLLAAHSLLLLVSILSLMFYGMRNPFDHFRSALLVMLPHSFYTPAHWHCMGNEELLDIF